MEYGINISFFKKSIGLKKAAELVSKAGFTQLNYTPALREDNWSEHMKEALKIFEANGLSVYQTHMPFNRYGSYGDMHRKCLDRCAEATEYMGAKFMVAHGDEFDFDNLEFSAEAALNYNHNYFLYYVERAKKCGYKIAFETVFEDLDCRRFTSKADELKGLIESFKSPSAVCCWDFGHAHIAFGEEAPNIIRDFGPLIQCTHLHDNIGADAHQIPFTGDINWKETISAFKDIGYDGVMSVEYAHGNMPETLAEEFIKFTYNAAKHVWNC